MERKKFFKYFREYKWSNVWAMIKNNKRSPEICTSSFEGKLVVITGATSGIGRATAIKYAANGANLLCINRNLQKSTDLKDEIEQMYGVKYHHIIADLSRLDDIYNAVEQLLQIEQKIDVIIHNAGVYLTKKETTPDGLDRVFTVHYLSSFIINYILKERLVNQSQARIILVNSEGHRFAAWGLDLDDLNWERRSYSGLKSYGAAKLAQLQSMLIFDKYFNNSNVTINAMHPGAVKSESGQENGSIYKWFKRNILERNLKSATISAEALYYLGVSKNIENVSGKFFNLTTEEEPTPPALDFEAANQLWIKSKQICGL